MAKRRRLTAPNAKALADLEVGFAAKPPLETKSMAPISQVAGEAAALANAADPRDQKDAAQLRNARAVGLLAETIAIADIDVDYISRDRVVQNADEMEELKASIAAQGQRTPIEVVRTDDGFGLISGWRRLTAMRDLGYERAKAFVRAGRDASDVYLDMIEENEIRANLTHYERGRIVSVAVGQGVFPDIETAVNHLFAAASKAKRSKVRSFAAIHEALGDLLQFPTALTEKLGLKVAQSLSAGEIKPLRAVLADNQPDTAAQEQAALLGALSAPVVDKAKGGRPTTSTALPEVTLKKGGVLSAQVSATGLKIDLQGRAVNADTAKRIMSQIEKILG